MRILSKESFSVVQQLMPDNYANLYSRMTLQLPPDVASTFAKYTKLTAHNSGQWSIDCEGEDDFKPITQANPMQRMLASETIARVTEVVNRSGIVADPAKLFSVPDESCIYFRQVGPGQVDVVLTEWGHRKIGSSSNLNNISLLVGGADSQDRADVVLRLQWSDGTPLVNTPTKIGIYGSNFDNCTDEQGLLHLGTVAANERFTVDVEGEPTQTLRTDSSSHEYVVTFPYYVDAAITVLNDKKEPQKNLRFTVNGTEVMTDMQGMCEFKKILLEKDTALQVDYQGHDKQKFPLHRDNEENQFVYVIKMPDVSGPPEIKGSEIPDLSEGEVDDTIDNKLKVRIRLVDKKRRPLTYTRVRVDVKKGFEEIVSDGEGYIFVERKAFTQGEKVKIKVLPGSPDKIPAPKPEAVPNSPTQISTPPVATTPPVSPPENEAAGKPTPPPIS